MNIGIVGLGLIGGSLGLDFRALGHYVLGVSRRPQTCALALERGVVDQASCDLSILAAAEVIFICTPISAIATTVDQLIPHLSTPTILTDVGSVKAAVVAEIAPRWPHFIGGHPMSGTAATGIESAQAHLFQGNAYVLTPTATTPPAVLTTVKPLVESLGGPVYQCDPAVHDRAVAWISHLPALVSTGLIAACLGETDPQILELAQLLASSGFRDTSRVGGGNPELTRMMAQHNREAVLETLQAYQATLGELIHWVEAADWDSLQAQCTRTQAARPSFLSPSASNARAKDGGLPQSAAN